MQKEHSLDELKSRVRELEHEVSRLKDEDEKHRIFEAFFNMAREALGIADLDGTIVYANQALFRLLAREDVLGTNIRDYFTADDLPELENRILPEVLEKGFGIVELPFTGADGKKKWVMQSAFRIDDEKGNPRYLANIISDIGSHKQEEERLEYLVKQRTHDIEEMNRKLQREILEHERAKKELEKREAALESIFRAAPTGIGMVVDRVIQQANLRFCEMLGYTIDELVGKDARMIYPSDEEYEYVGGEKYRQISEEGTGSVETRWQRKDGALIDVLLSSSPIDPNDLSQGVTFTALEITKRKSMEKSLNHELTIRTALSDLYEPLISPTSSMEDITHAILEKALSLTESRHGYVSSINPETGENVGHTLTEMLKGQCNVPDSNQSISFPRGDDGFYNGLWGYTLNKKKAFYTNDPSSHSASSGIPEGHIPIKRFLSIPVLLGEQLIGQVALANKETDYDVRDLVAIQRLAEFYALAIERKRAEEKRLALEGQLQQAHKMKAISFLAGGLAHEFNNALSSITGNIDLLEMELSGNKEVEKRIEPMMSSTRRMARLTSQLLAYAQGGKYHPKDISLAGFIEETLPIMGHTIRDEIRVETDLPHGIHRIEGDMIQLQMVLTAVISNSVEAIEGKGRIRIILRNEDVDEEFADQHPGLSTGPHVCLTIEDDGKGMDEGTKSDIFTPFFSTKFQGRGLSMAAVYGIVMNHEGWISVDSEPGKGTSVKIYFPATVTEVEDEEKSEITLIKGTGNILLIEDEQDVMDVTREFLEIMGYRVLCAKTGSEAVHVVKTFDGDIELAILDMILPDMEGKDVYSLLMKERPQLRVLVCSGYSLEGPAKEMVNGGANGFIQKPFSAVKLSEKVSSLLKKK